MIRKAQFFCRKKIHVRASLLSDPGVDPSVGDVRQQVDQHIDHRGEQHEALDHGVIPVGDGVHGQLPQPGPAEDRLNDDAAAKERADGEPHDREDGDGGVVQHVFQYIALLHAAQPGAGDIGLAQLLKDLRPKLADKAAADRNREREAGHDKALHALLRRQRQQMRLDAQKVHQQHRDQEVRQRVAGEAE